jgi:hydrogenase expression/formation protein HypE
MTLPGDRSLTCPIPLNTSDRVLLAHGEGAKQSRRLVRDVLLAAFDNEYLRPLADGATLPGIAGPFAMTTDSYVVSPLFFPGGDIGSLAVHGTVNDLAVCGAEPLYLSLAMIVEEGLALDVLRRVVGSVRDAARACGVYVVTGDTKVVPRGAADGLFLTTAGVGRLWPGVNWGVHRVKAGDRIIVSGTVGDHGMAILAAREALGFDPPITSDSAPLHNLTKTIITSGCDVRFVRDATRGGVSAVLREVIEATGLSARIDEKAVPISDAVRGASELLGLDPLYVANEGKLIAIVAPADADSLLARIKADPLGANAAIVGVISHDTPAEVVVSGSLGVARVLDEPSGSPLPRIC